MPGLLPPCLPAEARELEASLRRLNPGARVIPTTNSQVCRATARMRLQARMRGQQAQLVLEQVETACGAGNGARTWGGSARGRCTVPHVDGERRPCHGAVVSAALPALQVELSEVIGTGRFDIEKAAQVRRSPAHPSASCMHQTSLWQV